MNFVAMHESATGTSRYLGAAVKLCRFPSKADIRRQARPAAAVTNDRKRDVGFPELHLRKTAGVPYFANRSFLFELRLI